MSMSNV